MAAQLGFGPPTLARELAGDRQVDRTAGLCRTALAGEREQRREQLREALRLALRGLQLALEIRVVGPERGRLQPQPQAGERRAQLVGRIGDELALRLEHAPEPVGHVVEGSRDLALLRRAGRVRAGGEIAAAEPAGRGRKTPQRPRQRAREQPRERETERQRGGGDARDREPVAPDARVDRRCVARHAHGANAPALVHHGHGGVEELLVQRAAPPRPCSTVPTASTAAISGRSP